MPFWMATLTMAATWIDGGYLLGTAEGVFASIASGWQGGVCFGLSLVLGGVFSRGGCDELRVRHAGRSAGGTIWSALGGRAGLPAMLGEMFWSAELLVAIGATFGVMLGVNLITAIVVSAAVVTLYTLSGGMWSVGYTDTVQFAADSAGLAASSLPLALHAAGGLDSVLVGYDAGQGRAAAACFRRWRPKAIGRRADGQLVGPVDHAGVRRHSLELLLSADSVLPDAGKAARGIRSRPA